MISQDIRQRLEAMNMGAQLPRLAELQDQLRDLEKRLATAKGNIGLLDRLNILTDSPDEVKVKSLTAQIAGHSKDFVRIGAQWNQAMTDFEKEFPNFKIVRSVERFCASCLEYVFGQSANPVAQVTSLKEQIFKCFFKDFKLADLFRGLADPSGLPKTQHQELNPAQWPVFQLDELLAVIAPHINQFSGWNLDQPPAQLNQTLGQLAQQMGKYPPLGCVLALAQLEVLLTNSSPVKEASLNPDGSLTARSGVPLAPCIVDSLEQLLQTVRACFPDVPFGLEVQSWFRDVQGNHRCQYIGDKAKWTDLGATIQQRSLAVVALNSLLERAKSEVSWVDRVNVFSDSETEVREKKIKAALAEAKSDLLKLPEEIQRGPGQEIDDNNLAGTIAVHCATILQAIEAVSTNPGDSWREMNCELKNQAPLAEALGAFRSWLQDRYSFPFSLKQLLEQVAKSPAVDEPLASGNLPKILAARLASTPVNEMLVEARQKRQEALQAFNDRRKAVSQVSAFDRLNIFSESASEKAEKQADSLWRKTHQEATKSEDRLEATLMNALRQYPEAHLFYATEELSIQIPSLQAVCREKVTTNHNGDQKTRYFCEVIGLAAVEMLGSQLAQLAFSCGCIYGGQATNMMLRRLSWIEDPVLRSALPEAANQTQGLKPGEVQARHEQESLGAGGMLGEFYLAWCQQNGTGPASPGRF